VTDAAGTTTLCPSFSVTGFGVKNTPAPATAPSGPRRRLDEMKPAAQERASRPTVDGLIDEEPPDVLPLASAARATGRSRLTLLQWLKTGRIESQGVVASRGDRTTDVVSCAEIKSATEWIDRSLPMQEVKRRLQVAADRVVALCEAGDLEHRRFGQRWEISAASVDALEARLEKERQEFLSIHAAEQESGICAEALLRFAEEGRVRIHEARDLLHRNGGRGAERFIKRDDLERLRQSVGGRWGHREASAAARARASDDRRNEWNQAIAAGNRRWWESPAGERLRAQRRQWAQSVESVRPAGCWTVGEAAAWLETDGPVVTYYHQTGRLPVVARRTVGSVTFTFVQERDVRKLAADQRRSPDRPALGNRDPLELLMRAWERGDDLDRSKRLAERAQRRRAKVARVRVGTGRRKDAAVAARNQRWQELYRAKERELITDWEFGERRPDERPGAWVIALHVAYSDSAKHPEAFPVEYLMWETNETGQKVAVIRPDFERAAADRVLKAVGPIEKSL
jgi:hypothetical protein